MRTRFLSTALRSLLVMCMISTGLGTARAHGTAAGQPFADEHGQAAPPSSARERKHARIEADSEPAHDLQALAATPCVAGFAGPYPCDGVDLLSFVPLAGLGGSKGNDIWGWTDPVTGKEYAIMGLNNGTAFVDISDPELPILVGRLPSRTGTSTWRDIKTYADHAFIVSEAPGHGLQVFDLTALRGVATPPVVFSETAHYAGFGDAHNVAINESSGFAYAVGTNTCGGGLHMIDIADPANPAFAGCFSADGYSHDAQCVDYRGPDSDHQGKEICFNSNEDTITVVDVSNKAAPVQLSRTSYPGVGYVHQGWLTENHTQFLVDDEDDEIDLGHNTRTRIFDVSDLDAPRLVAFHDGATRAVDHNQYVSGSTLYQANYRAGLTLLDLDDVQHGVLREIGFFDVYPANDNPNFNGAWSVYPFFESGAIVVSGMEQGLFVLRPSAPSSPTIGIGGRPDPVDVGAPFTLTWSLSNPQAAFDGILFLGVGADNFFLPLLILPLPIPAGIELSDLPIATFPYPDIPLATWVIGLFDAGTGALLDFDLDIVATTGGPARGDATAVPR